LRDFDNGAGDGATATERPRMIWASSAVYALAYAAGLAIFASAAKRRGMCTNGIRLIMFAGVVGGLLGANVAQFIATDGPGKTILGGIAGGYLAVIAAKRYLGIVRPTGDLFALALASGEAIGRWGCFLAGCCYGKKSGESWGVWQHDAWRHPTQIYLSLAAAATYLILLRFERAKPPENALFFLQGSLMCTYRFAIEFWREGTAPYLGLDLAQWAALAGGAFLAWKFWALMRSAKTMPQLALAPA
jgi:phosphatidylglycerol:prolipoprotein diacylglycerol transferase